MFVYERGRPIGRFPFYTILSPMNMLTHSIASAMEFSMAIEIAFMRMNQVTVVSRGGGGSDNISGRRTMSIIRWSQISYAFILHMSSDYYGHEVSILYSGLNTFTINTRLDFHGSVYIVYMARAWNTQNKNILSMVNDRLRCECIPNDRALYAMTGNRTPLNRHKTKAVKENQATTPNSNRAKRKQFQRINNKLLNYIAHRFSVHGANTTM